MTAAARPTPSMSRVQEILREIQALYRDGLTEEERTRLNELVNELRTIFTQR